MSGAYFGSTLGIALWRLGDGDDPAQVIVVALITIVVGLAAQPLWRGLRKA